MRLSRRLRQAASVTGHKRLEAAEPGLEEFINGGACFQILKRAFPKSVKRQPRAEGQNRRSPRDGVARHPLPFRQAVEEVICFWA